MTELQWADCTDPVAMLEFVRAAGRTTERKLRLFAVACARSVWDHMFDATMRKAVEVAEGYVDGKVTNEQLEESHSQLYGLVTEKPGWYDRASAMRVSFEAYTSFFGLAWCCGCRMPALEKLSGTNAYHYGARLTRERQPPILRDIFQPFHPPCVDARNPEELTILARVIYDASVQFGGRLDQSRLADLAGMLETESSVDPAIQCHFRSNAIHVRGCWAVDLLIGKN